MKGIDPSGRPAAKVIRGTALADAIAQALADATPQEIRGFLGSLLRAGKVPADKAARVFRASPAQHFRDLGASTIPMPGMTPYPDPDWS